MKSYDVMRQDLFEIKSKNSYTYHVALRQGERIEGFGGVEVHRTGYRLLITSESPLAAFWGYRIDYNEDGNVIYPVTPRDIETLIRDLTAIGCYEYTPDLLRSIRDNENLLDAERDKIVGELDKITKIRL